jgi:hypothetical protein
MPYFNQVTPKNVQRKFVETLFNQPTHPLAAGTFFQELFILIYFIFGPTHPQAASQT